MGTGFMRVAEQVVGVGALSWLVLIIVSSTAFMGDFF